MNPADETATGIHANADFAPGTVLAGRFRIEALLGVGGMGVVYRATDLALDVPVALKLLRPELAGRPEAFDRFRQELLLARQVSNPHVVRIHDIAQHDGRWMISMDLVEGESLDHYLDRVGRLAVDDALRIARQVAEGLGAAHARGVVHRDLKPANVLIDAAGNAYVNDFGVARSLVSSGLTQSGATVGTPDYLSPEQARGERVDPRSDLYALGLILYEMLSGELPFAGGTVAEVLGQRMVRTPQPLTRKRPELPAWIARLVDKLLRPQPAHRFRDAAAVVAAIDSRQVPREFRPGRGTALGAVAALLLLGLGAGGWWWLQQAQAPPVVPPLHRLLVLPVASGNAGWADTASGQALDDWLLGASDHLRDAINGAGVAVVDTHRTQQALRQLDPMGTATPDPDALLRVAVADRMLAPKLHGRAGDWRIRAELHAGAQPPRLIEGAPAADPDAALLAWWRELRTVLGLAPDASLALPAAAALQSYGAGLRAQRDGDLVPALEQFRKASAAAPTDPLAWLAQASVAEQIGEDDTALAAVEQGQRKAHAAPQRMQQRFVARRALLEGDPSAAVAAWRSLAEASPDDTFAALELARARGAGGDFDAALAGLRKLSGRDDNDPRAWYEMGKFSILQGDARRAVDDYLVRALVLYKRSGDRYGQAETVNALGVGYGRLGQTDDAEQQYRQAVQLRQQVGNRRGVATSLRNLAGIVTLRGQFDEAGKDLDRARGIYLELGDRTGLAATETELGLLFEERGDYHAALDAYRRALQAWQQSGDAHGGAETLNHIGFAYYQLGVYDSAQAFWQQARDAYAKLGDRTGDVRTTQNLGLLDISRGNWKQARARLVRSLAEAQKQQMLEEAAVSRRNLAELELWQGHVSAALAQSDAALASFRQREDDRGTSDAALLRIQALLVAHADTQAQSELDALADLLATASGEQRAIAAIVRAELADRRGDKAGAVAARAEAARLSDSSGVRQLQLQVALQRADEGRLAASLDADTAALGHAGLRLRWLELDMRAALARQAPARAVQDYREAQNALRKGDYARAYWLHALGARALADSGDPVRARDAIAAADSALSTLREGMPKALLHGFDAAPEVATARMAAIADTRQP